MDFLPTRRRMTRRHRTTRHERICRREERMKIASLAPHGRGKQMITLEDGTSFVLSVRDVRLFSLGEETDIDPSAMKQIRIQLRSDCMRRCGALLGTRDYTEARLREKLRDAAFPEDVIDGAVEELKDAGYLDDLRYAESFLHLHAGDRSRLRIRHDLQERGVPAGIIDRAMREEDPEETRAQEVRQVLAILRKRRFDPSDAPAEEAAKIRNYLYRKGYSQEAVRAAMRGEYDG